jgi:hypothetical protein
VNLKEIARDAWRFEVDKVRVERAGWNEETPAIEIVKPKREGRWLYGIKPAAATENVRLAWPTGSRAIACSWGAEGEPLERAIEQMAREAHSCSVQQVEGASPTTIALWLRCWVTVRTHEGIREAEVLWGATDEEVMAAVNLGNSALAAHRQIEGKCMELVAILPEWIYMISEVEQEMMELGYVREGWEAMGRRQTMSEGGDGWYKAGSEQAPPPPEDEEPTEAEDVQEEDADDENGQATTQRWTPEGWPTPAQAKRREAKDGWVARRIHLGKARRAVWLTERADEDEVRATALERYKDRIAEPIEVCAEGEDGDWRISKSKPADGNARGQVTVTDGRRSKRVNVTANTSEHTIYWVAGQLFEKPVGSFTLSFDGSAAFPTDMTKVKEVRMHPIEGAEDGGCFPVVFTHSGERRTHEIPRGISEPDLHAIIRRMYGLEERAFKVRYGGGGPFRVQPNMSITVTEIRPEGGDRSEARSITMQRGQDTQRVEVDGDWNAERLREEAQRRWPDLGEFTLRYGESVDFQLWDGIKIWVSEAAQGQAAEHRVDIRYDNKC